MLRSLVVLLALLLPVSAAADDLTVAWISRQPEMDYVWGSANPKVEGWPAGGEAVSWRAHVRNFGVARIGVAYHWTLDGETFAGGMVSLAADAITTVDVPWSWTFERHRLGFAIDSGAAVAEESETNNELEVFTDALSVGFWVEQSMYDWFRNHQNRLGIGSTSWENWAQRLISFYNDTAQIAVYDETPDGVHDRWRLQKIVVVPDGALPLTPLPDEGTRGGEPNGATHPDKSDRSVDLVWGFPTSALRLFTNVTDASLNNFFYMAPVYIHELGHARYLVDVYAYDVRHQPPFFVVDVDPALPRPPFVYYTPEQGLMNKSFTFIDRYSAIALNQLAGHRATFGNYNEPENFGSFMNDLPAENRLTIRNASGALLKNAEVAIFQAVGGADAWYAAEFDETPDLVLRTDDNGQVLVGRNPFSKSGPPYQYWQTNNSVVIVRAKDGETDRYGFLEARVFHLAYWRGDTQLADHELVAGAQSCGDSTAILRAPLWDAKPASGFVTLQWSPVSLAESYRVWASTDGAAPRVIATTASTTLQTYLPGRVYWWVEASVGGCAPRRSNVGRFTAPAGVQKRRAAR
jgi:hypothetical protein